jgi:hypothetical protein
MMKKMAARLVVGFMLLFGGLTVISTPAQAGGGVDITGWCRQYYNSQYFNAIVVTYNVYGWRCQYGSDTGTRLDVYMNAACARQYGNPGTARFTNYSNPYSWYCV